MPEMMPGQAPAGSPAGQQGEMPGRLLMEKFVIPGLAAMGEGGDDRIGHLSTQDRVFPQEFLRKVGIKSKLRALMKEAGIKDPSKYTVGNPKAGRNKITGMQQFEGTGGEGEGEGPGSEGGTGGTGPGGEGTGGPGHGASAGDPGGGNTGNGTGAPMGGEIGTGHSITGQMGGFGGFGGPSDPSGLNQGIASVLNGLGIGTVVDALQGTLPDPLANLGRVLTNAAVGMVPFAGPINSMMGIAGLPTAGSVTQGLAQGTIGVGPAGPGAPAPTGGGGGGDDMTDPSLLNRQLGIA